MFIAPLDGKQEKAGDAIFANESRWVLIEFKRDKKSISSEIEKFKNYSDAKKALEPTGAHHLIIFGEADDDQFSLKSEEYFSGRAVNIDQALLSGAEKKEFLKYLNKFIDFKNKDRSGTGGYSFVAGVSNDGKVTKCMKLSEFGQALALESELRKKLQKKLEQSQEQSYSGPSR